MIEIRDLRKMYQTGNTVVRALDGVTTRIGDGEIVAVIGKSGSGKTTLLHALGGMDVPAGGEIVVDGSEITGKKEKELADYRLRKIGFVFQDFMLLDGLTIQENILVPRIIQDKVTPEAQQLAQKLTSLFGIAHICNKYPAEEAYLSELIDILGLEEKLNVYPGQLSGGQKQRVAIGRAMVHKPGLLLADEPTGNLDSATAGEILDLLLGCAKRFDQTMVIVTHDMEVAGRCGRGLEISDGKIVGSMKIGNH